MEIVLKTIWKCLWGLQRKNLKQNLENNLKNNLDKFNGDISLLNKYIETEVETFSNVFEDAVKALKSVIGAGDRKRVDISAILSRRIMN